MFDFTNYTQQQLYMLLSTLFTETTKPVYSPDDDNKVIGEPIYTRGIGFDTESTTLKHTVKIKKHEKTVIDHCFLYTYQLAIGTVEEIENDEYYYAIYRTYEDFLDFISVLNKVLEMKNKTRDIEKSPRAKCWFWVGNLPHEWSFIKYDMCNRFTLQKCFAKSARDVMTLDFGNFVFRECIGLFGHSVAHIGKTWCKTQKLTGDVDFNLIRHEKTKLAEKDKSYMINDALILSEMHGRIIKQYLQKNGGLIIPTTASGFVRMMLKDAIRNDADLTDRRDAMNFNRKKPIKTNLQLIALMNRSLFVNEAQWSLCRNYGYNGGLSGSNIDFVGKELTNVQCIDLTSDYPAQLLHKKYPSGRLREKDLSEWENVKNSGKPYFIVAHISEIKSKSHHATMSKHKILNYKHDWYKEKYGEPTDIIVYNGKIRQAKNMIVVLNDVDLRAYANIYDFKMSPLKIWQFDNYRKIPVWLANCIIDTYAKKAMLKLQGLKDTIEYNDAKRDVNTFYGVLATRLTDLFNVFKNGLFEPEKEKTFKDIKRESWLNPYIAFYCTSYAREILMSFIGKYPDLIIQYDTDSLYYTKKNCEELEKDITKYNDKITALNEKIFKKHPNKDLFLSLGTWDLESCYSRFLALGAKKYIKQDEKGIHTVIAGLPKKAIPKEIEECKINKPFTHYNVLRKFIEESDKAIVIKHVFADKFASVYNDNPYPYYIDVTDYQGITHKQRVTSYHAITEIDFTLSMSKEFLTECLHVQNRP